MIKHILGAALLASAGTLAASFAHGTALAAPGNSGAAHACQHGGYASLIGGTSTTPDPTVTFSNTGQCVSYAAQGGALWAFAQTEFSVDSLIPTYQDTGVALTPGEVVVLTATGSVVWNHRDSSGPDGNGVPATPDFLAPGLSEYSLVGQVGSGTAFEAGSGPTTVTGTGELGLAFNDNVYPDNVGSFSVSITTYSPVA